MFLGALAMTAAVQFPLPTSFAPTEWVLLGKFPQQLVEQSRDGFARDYLAEMGGESGARLVASTTLGPASAKVVQASPEGLVDFVQAFEAPTDLSVAYAYGEVTSDQPFVGLARFGSDDSAKVWVNGELVHSIETPGRGVIAGEDRFEVRLAKGLNRFLVKVENGSGGWGFSLALYDQAGELALMKRQMRGVLSYAEMGRSDGPGMILEGRLPGLVWKDPMFVEAMFVGEPTWTWYGPDLEPAANASKPGLYVAVVEQRTVDGAVHTRYVPAYQPPTGMQMPPPGRFVDLPALPVPAVLEYNLTPDKVEKLGPDFTLQVWEALFNQIQFNADGPYLAAMLLEPPSEEAGETLRLSRVRVYERMLALRHKLESVQSPGLEPPKRRATPARVLRSGSEAEAGMAQGTTEAVQALCEAWIQDDPTPFNVLIARHGVVFYEQGFGQELDGSPVRPDAPFPPASIGKLVAGLTFARFVDQGLVDLDDPVSSVLPGFDQDELQALTFRYCFTHLSGLFGHASNHGLFNPVLDQALKTEGLAFEKPGVLHRYGGDGNNLAGKAMERLAGKSMFRILYENMQAPFDEHSIRQVDLGFGTRFTPRYLAKVGQLMLNQGSYGEWELFTPETYARLLPVRLADYAPALADKALVWGVGITPMLDMVNPGDEPVLGPNVIGHGAASSSVFRVCPDQDMVIVVGRRGSKDYAGTGIWAAKLAKVLADRME